MTERITSLAQQKNDFKSLQLGLREVHDRPIGAFDHSIKSLRNNSFAIVSMPSIGEIGLISKTRNYSNTPYDVMISYLTDDISAIDEASSVSRNTFFGLLAELHTFMSRGSGLQIAIGLNQHPDGFMQPEKSSTGQKNRVQTLQPLHAHVYEVSSPPDRYLCMGDLPRDDQRDMCDPLLAVSGEIVRAVLTNLEDLKAREPKIETSLATPPLGINIHLNRNLHELLYGHSQLLCSIQRMLRGEYSSWVSLFENDGILLPSEQRVEAIVQRLKTHGTRYSRYTKKILMTLAKNLKDISNVELDQIFIKGLAITYTFIEDVNANALISIHPRLMSRGNSADACCLYVDNKEGENEEDLKAKKTLYRDLVEFLTNKYDVKEGEFLKNG